MIGGFSQGAATSSAVALGKGRPRPAGLLMMSGFLPLVSTWPLDFSDKQGMPAYVTHGIYDPVIPFEFGRKAAELLSEGGLNVIFREGQVPHAIDPRLLPEMRQWVASVIAGQPVAEGPASSR